MSITSIMYTGVSGLQAAQTQLQVVSENVTNVDTPGYIRKIADQVSTATAGTGTGVEIAGIRLATDTFLENASRQATSATGSADAQSQYFGRVQQLFGDPSASTSFFSQVATAYSSFASLAQNPTSIPFRQQSISAVQSVFSQASTIYAGIQQVRADADGQISADVTQVNNLLGQIEQLNTQISKASTSGQDTSAEADRQQQLIGQLSNLMDVKVSSRATGGVTVRTTDGLILAGDGAATLKYTPSSTVNGQTVFNPITITPPGGVPVDLDQHISSGEIDGLIQLRDVQAPQTAARLGELTSQIADQLNKAGNASSAAPPPSSLTGKNIGLDLPSAISGFTGKTNVLITDSSGVIQHTLAIDFGSGSLTLDGAAAGTFTGASFLGQVNAALGGLGSASFANGQLTLQASGGAGVAVADDPTTPSANGGRGFSWYFGLNDIVQSNGIATYQTGLTTGSANNFGAGGTIKFNFSSGPGTNVSKVSVNVPSGGTMASVLAALNDPATGVGQFGSFALDANGELSFTPSTHPPQTLAVASDTTSWAGGPSMTQLFGVGAGVRADRAGDFTVRPGILQNPSSLAISAINLSALSGQPAIVAGDGSGAQAMSNAGQTIANFDPAGGDPGGQQSVTNYASNFAGAIGEQAQQLKSQQSSADSMQTAAAARLSSSEGVNLDQELTNLETFQQAYSASGRIIEATNVMFTALMGIFSP